MPEVIHEPHELREYVAMLKRGRASLGLVPTMGALHEGHRSLMRRSYAENDRTIVSVYVNPLQFGPGEDFERYPRTLEADLEACGAEHVNVVFAPSTARMQPPGRSTVVRVDGVSHDYEGAERPGHFDGVATIVARLLNLAQPDRAYFGQKDYQQSVVIRRMVTDLAMPVEVTLCPTVRDSDGLALSSRNRFLTPQDREEALRLPRALEAAEQAVRGGELSGDAIQELMLEQLASPREDVTVDYADLVTADTLAHVERLERRGALIAALRVGATRLIDNRIVSAPGVAAWEA